MAATVKWEIQVEGVRDLQRALRVLQEPDAPFLREALDKAGRLLRDAAERRTKGGIARAVQFTGVKGSRGSLRAQIRIKHPGARAMEFGRELYYRGYSGRGHKATGIRFRVPAGRGQKARPYLGIIKGDAAIAAVHDEVRDLLVKAFNDEWNRIGAPD